MKKTIMPINIEEHQPKCNPENFTFTTTDELPTATNFFGQHRAIEAIQFGANIKKPNYHIYVMGPNGLGKRSIATEVLQQIAAEEKTPSDWCYVNNFNDPQKPVALEFPAGKGSEFKNDIQLLLDELTFNSPDSEEFLRKHPDISSAPEDYISNLKQKYDDISGAEEYLNALQMALNVIDASSVHQYSVNLLVDNRENLHAPVIYTDNPSYAKLFGRIEHISQNNVLLTSHLLIKPGALHKANGGYLLIDANKIVEDDDTFLALKRILMGRKISVESPESSESIANLQTLEPSSIPLDIKIILLGERSHYYSLCVSDPDFEELFNVTADFSGKIVRTDANIQTYAQLIASLAYKNELKPLQRDAIARIIDYSSHLVDDNEMLSLEFNKITNLLIDANHWATKENEANIDFKHVQYALDFRERQIDRVRRRLYEEIQRNIVQIQTDSGVVGQINALTIIEMGRFAFGIPARITATTRLGDGDVVDIEREVELAGSFHSKGVMILSGYFGSQYTPDKPLSLSASLVFEQSYASIEGDSASAAELCALLSAVAQIPLKQSFAITGAIDQHGNLQAVGDVSQKIEGFFDICKHRKLTGEQGVIIPSTNLVNLMLRDEIVTAIKTQQFHIYAVDHINDAMTLLTGKPAGMRSKTGKYPVGSINYLVEKNLLKLERSKEEHKTGS